MAAAAAAAEQQASSLPPSLLQDAPPQQVQEHGLKPGLQAHLLQDGVLQAVHGGCPVAPPAPAVHAGALAAGRRQLPGQRAPVVRGEEQPVAGQHVCREVREEGSGEG